jgi:hypothetical protein
VRTLRVSNGYLSPLEEASAAQLKCQKGVANAVRGFTSKTYQIIGKCVDAVLKHTLLDKPEKPALKKCSIDTDNPKSMVSAIDAAQRKAADKIAKKCGGLSDSSVPYTESQIHTHLGMARCRAEELAGATYNRAVDMIGEVLEAAAMGDHHEVQEALPCQKASIE